MLRCKYFKSDFDVILDIGGIPDLEVDNWFAYDFRAIIYCRNDSTNRIIASNKDGKATNCINENGKIHIIAHKHGFAAGTVMCEFFAHIPDEKYPHGYRIEAKPFPIIELTNNAGDDVSTVSISTTIAVVSVNAYQQAVKQGFTGTQEEYYAGLGMLPDLAALTSDLRQGKREIAAALWFSVWSGHRLQQRWTDCTYHRAGLHWEHRLQESRPHGRQPARAAGQSRRQH